MDVCIAEKMAKDLINQYIPDWKFNWNNRKTTLGVCSHTVKTIYLSKPITILNTKEEVLNTIRHEVAHALVGPGHAHDSIWRDMAIKLGCTGERCGKVRDDSQEAKKVLGVKYQMIISTTGEVIRDYYRKPAEKTVKTINTRYIPGRKEETLGKLIIVPYKPLVE